MSHCSKDSNTDVNLADQVNSCLMIFLKGFAMGLSDSVPGVSGATIALLTNIYERLVLAIKSINFISLYQLFTDRRLTAWRDMDGTFLITLALGIALGIFISASTNFVLIERVSGASLFIFYGISFNFSLDIRQGIFQTKIAELDDMGYGSYFLCRTH